MKNEKIKNTGIPQDFVRDVALKVDSAVVVVDSGHVARPNFEPEKFKEN